MTSSYSPPLIIQTFFWFSFSLDLSPKPEQKLVTHEVIKTESAVPGAHKWYCRNWSQRNHFRFYYGLQIHNLCTVHQTDGLKHKGTRSTSSWMSPPRGTWNSLIGILAKRLSDCLEWKWTLFWAAGRVHSTDFILHLILKT